MKVVRKDYSPTSEGLRDWVKADTTGQIGHFFRMTFRHCVASVVLVVALFSGACSSDGDDLGAMELERTGGHVEIHRGDQVIKVTDVEKLEPQDVIETGPDGVARLSLDGDNEVAMRGSSRLRIRSTTAIEGEGGGLVATATGDEMKVLFGDVTATFSDAQFRLDRGFGSARAASYSGEITLDSPGQPMVTLPALNEVDVAAGDLPDAPSPYELDIYDGWDKEYLPEVVDLTEELDALATGFARQLASRPPLGYLANLAGGSNIGFVRSYLRRPPADLLVGFTIANNDQNRSLKQSFDLAFELHDDGALWGVAATIMDVRTEPLVAQLEDLILDTEVLAAGGGGGTADFTIAASDGSSAGSSSGAGGDGSGETVIVGGTGGGDGDGDGDGDGGDGDGDGGGGESEDCSDFASCTVEEVEDELPPGPSGGSEPEPEPKPTNRDLDILDSPPNP
jgi:hypothetical protein